MLNGFVWTSLSLCFSFCRIYICIFFIGLYYTWFMVYSLGKKSWNITCSIYYSNDFLRVTRVSIYFVDPIFLRSNESHKGQFFSISTFYYYRILFSFRNDLFLTFSPIVNIILTNFLLHKHRRKQDQLVSSATRDWQICLVVVVKMMKDC